MGMDSWDAAKQHAAKTTGKVASGGGVRAARSRARGARTLPMGPSFMVRRTALIQEVIRQVSSAGIGVVCAPKGFGKTALLIQYVDEVANDPERGNVRLIDAEDAVVAELSVQIEEISETFAAAPHPAIAIDNLPPFEGSDVDAFIDVLRDARAAGIEVVVACTPAAGELTRRMGDAAKFGAQQLKIQPREFAEWSHALSISASLDVYTLTQGVPLLVAALQGMTDQTATMPQPVESYVVDMYRTMLEELNRIDVARYKLAAMLLLAGDGNFSDLARAGLDASAPELRSLLREYPVFGEDRALGTFTCLGSEPGARRQVREGIARDALPLVRRTARALLKAGRADRAVALVDEHLSAKEAAGFVDAFPLLFAMHGHARFVSEVTARRHEAGGGERASLMLELAVYASSLTAGDYRLARAVGGELRLRVDEVVSATQRQAWEEARLLARSVSHASGLDLPAVGVLKRRGSAPRGIDCEALEVHARCRRALIEGGTWAGDAERLLERVSNGLQGDDAVDIPLAFLRCDVMLAEALMGSLGHIGKDDAELAVADRVFRERKLAPLVNYARLVRSARRLLAGSPLIDERAFTDAGTAALRASDLSLQLLATLFAGWQELVQGQAINARFRAQQVLKLADEGQPYLQMQAGFLERIAHLCGMSRGAVREEAGLQDLNRKDVTPAEAWECAACLSAARDDAELAAWFSLHKETLLTPSFRLFARLAISVLGPRADVLRRMLPAGTAPYYLFDEDPKDEEQPLFELFAKDYSEEEVGRVSIRLLGGFSVTRNGHVLTDTIWKRRKIGLLAARLAIERGTYVTRRTITEEIWPGLDYAKARENLYSTLSTLRHALGQRKDGPQYIVTQGDGIAFNSEFVDCDVVRFGELAREILLGHLRMSSSQLISMCLKVESLYVGPLLVPDRCTIPYFTHMRHVLQTKFIDCMIRGVDVAIEEEDVNSALWMIEAALRSEAGREDVVRRALQVYELAGRYSDVEEVYRMHREHLRRQADRAPEPETERVYRQIEGRRLRYGA